MRTGVGVRQDVESLRVHRHERVFDPVVDHLHEVSRARGATVQVPLLGGAVPGVASRSARRGAYARSERLEDRIEMGHRRLHSPPIIRQYPRSSPHTPPLTPAST